MYALTADATRYLETYTMKAGLSGTVLMENAGRSVAEEIIRRFPDRETTVLVMCGKGNNGGDAVVCARWLLASGYKSVTLFYTGERSSMGHELSLQITVLSRAFPGVRFGGIKDKDYSYVNRRYDVIVDGMYGIGLNRPLSDDDSRMIRYLNSKSGYKVAVDIPSGIGATGGSVQGEAFRADLTVTFGSSKTGMYFGQGRLYCGEIVVSDIGFLPTGYDYITDKLFICDSKYYRETADAVLVRRDETGHKGTFGTVGIVVSTNGMMGASILAARAAYRAGCGLVRIFCPEKHAGFFNVSVPEAVVVPYKSDEAVSALSEFTGSVDALLIGPGLREDGAGKLLVREVLSQETPVVADAGALNIIARSPKILAKRKCVCVITPHLGEMAKLCGTEIDKVSEKRAAYTKEFSEHYKISMAVKSDVTLLSLRDGPDGMKMCLAVTGNSGLATAGSGDVLAGVIASLIAQGNTPDNSLLYGVLIHGAAAEKAATDEESRRRMMAGDIIDNLF